MKKFEQMEFMEKMEFMDYLQSDISRISVWSYKYGILMSPKRMKEIQEEETEYINAHNKRINEEAK